MFKGRLLGILEALFVTFLWSSSYILVKIGLNHILIQPITLVALRYTIASAVLIPMAIRKGGSFTLKDSKNFLKIAILGLTGYTVAQGLQCLGLFYLPAVSVTFILNFTPVMVMVIGLFTLAERPTKSQLLGLGLVLMGAYLFFKSPLSGSSLVGVLITLISGLGWALYMVYSRHTFIYEEFDLLGLTAFSMGFGTFILIIAAFTFEGVSNIPLSGWGIIVWLGVINTALAFFFWNHALQRLEAFETSVLQNTMLIQIAILSWFFLRERVTILKLMSIAIVFVGVLIVQLKK